jgi:hypothetical protein
MSRYFAGLGKLKLTGKIGGLILATLAVTSGMDFLVTRRRINTQAEESFVDRLRKTEGMATAVLTYFYQNIDNFVPHQRFKRISQVPVVVAWTVVREYAESQSMKFSTPSLAPRDPENVANNF